VSQEAWIVLFLKIGIISGFLSLVGWVLVYSRLAAWWHNAIGRTLVVKSMLLAGLLVPSGLSLFFHFNRLTSLVAGWVDVALIGLISPAMWWRTAVWVKESRKHIPGPQGVGDEEDSEA
jgi:hypothetical protein